VLAQIQLASTLIQFPERKHREAGYLGKNNSLDQRPV
jgi:hypothetical protein